MSGNNNRKFHLKAFSLYHHRSTMKVGTDATILGIWTDVNGTNHILDVGCGSGILSLLLASRSDASIDAVELETDSAVEAALNFSQSPFHHRLKLIESDFNILSAEITHQYDLIISNPPFFINDSRSQSVKTSNARHGDTLSYSQLINGVTCLLKQEGKFSVVLPYKESQHFIKIAQASGLFLHRQLHIYPFRGHQPNRINMQFGFSKMAGSLAEKLVIREENRKFTDEYKKLVTDYLISIY